MSKQTELAQVADTITVNSGNVGIGITPTAKLHLGGTNPNLVFGTSGNELTYLQRYNDDFYIFNKETTGSMLFGTANLERMRIDSAGRVTMPYQPAFWVRRNGDQTGYHPSYYNQSVIYNYKEFDVGNDVSTTTGLFTAPVSGVYIFIASAYSLTHNWSQAWFTFNGGRYAGTDFHKSSDNSIVVVTGHTRLAAGDTIGFHPYSGGSNATIRANVNHTWFRGSLIG